MASNLRYSVGPRSTASGSSNTARRGLVANQLLDAAATLFAERGFRGTSLQEIADAMGVTRPALYYYVKNKEALAAELVHGLTEAAADRLAEIRALEGRSCGERIALYIRDNVERIVENQARFRFIERSEDELPTAVQEIHRAAKRRILDELSGLIADGVVAGELRPVDERIAAFALIGMTNWVAWWYRPDSGATGPEITEALIEIALRGYLREEGRRDHAGAEGAIALLREDLAYLERIVTAAPVDE